MRQLEIQLLNIKHPAFQQSKILAKIIIRGQLLHFCFTGSTSPSASVSISIADERCSSNLTDDTPRCQFSVFLPSSIAFEQFYSNTEYNTNITQDICRFRYVSEVYRRKVKRENLSSGFRSGSTQTGRYRHRRWLEACNFRFW